MIKKLIHYFKIYYRLQSTFKKRLWQAAWYSLIAECNLQLNRLDSFKTYETNQPETPLKDIAQKREVLWMKKIMRILENRAPWTPMCLNRATVAKRLLRRQGIETTIHVGFKARKENEEFEGHAWLTIGGFFITGRIPQLRVYQELKPMV